MYKRGTDDWSIIKDNESKQKKAIRGVCGAGLEKRLKWVAGKWNLILTQMYI